MRRMLIPLAGLVMLSVVGCHLVQGQCDCDNPPVRPVAATGADLATPVVGATGQSQLVPVPRQAEPIKEMPRLTPDKE